MDVSTQATLIPKLRVHFAEFLSNASSVGLRILSSSTCVGLRYGQILRNSGFSRQILRTLRYLIRYASHIRFPIRDFSLSARHACPRSTLLGCPCSLCPHSSDNIWCRNINLLSIDYAVRPRLRSRLPQGRSALPWNPWIFGLEDSHLYLATHSGILSSQRSAAPYRYSFNAAVNAPLPINITRR